jgi:hypothetical protein
MNPVRPKIEPFVNCFKHEGLMGFKNWNGLKFEKGGLTG